MATEEEIVKVMKFLSAAYPQRELSAETIAVYVASLADVDGELLWLAAQQAVRELKYFPTVAELLEIASRISNAFGGPGNEMTSGQAWALVMGVVRRYGFYKLTDPDVVPGVEAKLPALVVRAVHAVGGWRDLCLVREDQVMPTRAHFYKVYEQLQRRQREVRRLHPAVRQAITAARAALKGNGEVEAKAKGANREVHILPEV